MVGYVRGSGQRGGLDGLPTPLVVLSAGGVGSTLLLLPTSWFCSYFFISGIWVFLVFLYLIVHKLPQLHIHAVIFKPLWILCILLPGNICSGANIAAKGLRSQVSACLKHIGDLGYGYV